MRYSRAVVMLATMTAIIMLIAGCAADGAYYHSVGDLLGDPDLVNEPLTVGGVFVETPVITASGTVFTIADSVDADERLNVYIGDTELIETTMGHNTLSERQLFGIEVIVKGRYDGQVFSGTDVIVKSGGGYVEPTSTP